MADALQERIEGLGPAERIVQTLTTFTDHLFHGRPGLVTQDGRTRTGVRWESATKRKQEDGSWHVFLKTKAGKKTVEKLVGVLCDDGQVRERADMRLKSLGEFRNPGISPEVATYLYQQVADVFTMDNEFVARWASWAAARDHRDMKVVLAAFLLVQNRSGEPVKGADGSIEFYDDDYREVAEAMCLLRRGKVDLSPKALLRIAEVLKVEAIQVINRELGFNRSARNPNLKRYRKVIAKWLAYREANVPMLDGLVKAGMHNIVKSLAREAHYKPTTPYFYEALRWKQKQADTGHRTLAIGKAVKAAESWEGLTEAEVCQRIVADKPNYKRIVGLLPKGVGLTRAVVMAAVEAGSLSDADLIMYSPTWEALGLLKVQSFKARWDAATAVATNQRAANIAKNVKSKEAREGLEEAADVAVAKAVEEVTRDLRTYFIIDKSSSMGQTLARMQANLTKFLGGFPLDRTHVSVFNTVGREITIKAATQAGVRQAFQGHTASGGTSYASGVKALEKRMPLPGEDALMIFAGDEQDFSGYGPLVQQVQRSGINPVAFGLLMVPGGNGNQYTVVRDAAKQLGIPCFIIDDAMFDDPYSVTRTLTNLIASTPVGAAVAGAPAPRRKGLVEEILDTPLLAPPVWAKAA
tara:strand:+ start:1359 stop:3272 length:1914 start_codon:yes stop_codon:yes gene_type:complete